jgi:hypothetical protein
VKTSYIIGSGSWWDKTPSHPGSLYNKSAAFIRTPAFFDIWRYFVLKYTSPEKIIIVDSASPCPPKLPRDPRFEFVRLPKNFGHQSVTVGKYCGWTRGLLTGAFYALMSSADYFIYIEQDCLVYGKGWVERVLRNMYGRGISFGYFPEHGPHATDTVSESEPSLTVIHRDCIKPAIDIYMSIQPDDKTMCSDYKFDQLRRALPFTPLPFGYGRARPINFSDRHFYAQHWSENELKALFQKALRD